VAISRNFDSMTILPVPLPGAGDALGAPVADDAQLHIEPRFAAVDDEPDSILPAGFLSGNQLVRVVRLPRTLRSIGRNVFSRMRSLEGIDLSATTVETIGDWFLLETESAKSCRFPPTLRGIGSFCLYRTSIKQVDLSHTLVTALPPEFLSSTPVEVLLVPRSLERIDHDALKMTRLGCLDCSHTRLRYIASRALRVSPLVDLRLPSGLEGVAFSALQHTQIRVVRVGDVEIPWVNEDLFDPEVRELRLPSFIFLLDCDSLNGTSLQRVDLSSAKVYHIEENVLCDNPSLEQVVLPRILRGIQNGFLNRAPNVQSLDLRCTQLRTVCDDFLLGTPVEEIWFPDSLIWVGERFLVGARVTSLDLSKTLLTSVGAGFLQQCDQLQTLLLPEWFIDIPANLPCAKRTTETIILPGSIDDLGSPSFVCAPFLRSMDLSQTTLRYLPSGFLSEAPNLTDVRLPVSLEFICDDVFLRTSLLTVDLRLTKLRCIGERFCAFSPLKQLYVPEGFSPRLVARIMRHVGRQVMEGLPALKE
jgi:hypothetical protein